MISFRYRRNKWCKLMHISPEKITQHCYLCEHHFPAESINSLGKRRRLKFGALPKSNVKVIAQVINDQQVIGHSNAEDRVELPIMPASYVPALKKLPVPPFRDLTNAAIEVR